MTLKLKDTEFIEDGGFNIMSFLINPKSLNFFNAL